MSRRSLLPVVRPGPALLATGAVAAAGVGTAISRIRRGITAPAATDADPSLNNPPRFGQAPTGVASTDGLRLHVRSHGSADAPATVVFVHGWTMSSEFWTPHAEALARRGLRTVTYDQRGHGRSGRPDVNGFDLSHLGDDLEAVLVNVVDPEQPTVLVGHSMGAMSILAHAGRQPATRHSIVGTVLANTSCHAVVPDALVALTGTGNGLVHSLLRQAVQIPVPLPPGLVTDPIARPLVRRMAFGGRPHPTAVELTRRLFLATHPTVRVGFARQIDVLDLRSGAAALTVPTLVVVGGQDRLTPPEHGRQLASMVAQGRLAVFDDVGHQAPLERFAETLDLIQGHVAETVPGYTPTHDTLSTAAAS